MRSLLLFLLAGLVSLVASAQQRALPFVSGTWNDVLAQAKADHRPIFLYAGSPKCHFCHPMETVVFPDSAVRRYYAATFVSYKVNIEEGEGAVLAKRYAITGLPAYLFFSSAGELLHLSSGYKPAAAFLQDGKDALNPAKAFVTLQRRYQAGDRQPDFLYNYGTASAWAPQDPLYDEVNAAYWATQSPTARTSTKNLDYIFHLYTSFPAPTTQYFLTHAAAFEPRFGPAGVRQKLRGLVSESATTLGQGNNQLGLQQLHQALGRSGLAGAAQWQALAQIQYLLGQPQRDWPAYAAAVLAYGQQYAAQDSYTLYEATEYIVAFVDDKTLLAQADQVMQLALAAEPSYGNLCTRVKVLHKLGRRPEALQVVQEAVALATQEKRSAAEAIALRNQITQNP